MGECVGSIVAHPLQRLKLDLAWNPAVGRELRSCEGQLSGTSSTDSRGVPVNPCDI